MFTSKLPLRIGTIVIVLMLALGGVQPALAQTPSNDNFASATAIGSLPYSTSVDLSYASYESNEPYPYCGYGYTPKSVWFSFTPLANVTVTAQSYNYNYYPPPILAVYTGTELNNLTQRTCQNQVTVQAEAGTTYYFQLSSLYPWYGGYFSFSLDFAPPPNVYFNYNPYDPSTFDTVNFDSMVSDPAQIYGGTLAWDFGDGTTSASPYPSHQYAKDGDYSVNLSYTTSDGRTGSSGTTIQVRTRDVAITKFSVPQTAKSNTTKEIAVEVTNRRYSDNVQVQLYKGLPGGGEQLIGTLTIFVPARATRATLFKFSYTYTGCDATVGKVTFRTIATLMSGRDALPADNTLIRTTLVSGTKGPCGPISYP